MSRLRRVERDHYQYLRILSEYCGLGHSEGPPHHAVDALCMQHDHGYQRMLDEGYDPYHNWNYYDEQFLQGLGRVIPGGLREQTLHTISNGVFRFKRWVAEHDRQLLEEEHWGTNSDYSQPSISHESDSEGSSDEEYKESERMDMDVITAEGDAEHQHGGNNGGSGSRKRRAVEPRGHGNTPATGTELAGFIPKYLPVNFPDKFTVKQKYVDSFIFRSAATAGVAAVPFYLTLRTNSTFAIQAGIGGGLGFGAHQPNQRDNWAAQYGYYRVTNLSYSFKCQNVSSATFVETANPPGAFTNAISVSDAVITLAKTQTFSDIQSTASYAKWEQKISDNVVLGARAPGCTTSFHEFKGHVTPEDYDMDPVTTAADETWTAVGVSPSQNRWLILSGEPQLPYTTTALLPEIAVAVFMTLEFTVQYAGYLPALRQVPS